MRERYARGGTSQPLLAAEFGVSQTTMWRIVNRKSWSRNA